MKYEICVIGTESFLFPFLQFGFTTFTPSSEKDLRSYLKKAAAENYGIIYIEDSFCFQISDIINKYENSLTPIFIPIGSSRNGESYSGQILKDMMKKAVGMTFND